MLNPQCLLQVLVKKISIFDLDTKMGDGKWFAPFSTELSTDTNGNLYTGSRYTPHYAITLKDTKYICTYPLENKYSICEGQIVWSQYSKNVEGYAWIEFYSDNELIYKTDEITNEGNVVTFNFSVKDLNELKIVKNSTISYTSYYHADIIYPYLNLVE